MRGSLLLITLKQVTYVFYLTDVNKTEESKNSLVSLLSIITKCKKDIKGGVDT